MFFLFLPEKKKKILKIQRKSNLPSTFSFIKESTEAEIRRIPRANRARSLFLFRFLIRRSVEIKNAFEENIFLLLLLHFLYFKQIQIQKNRRNSFVKRYFNSNKYFSRTIFAPCKKSRGRIYRVQHDRPGSRRNTELRTRRKIPLCLVSHPRTILSIRGQPLLTFDDLNCTRIGSHVWKSDREN